jgi:hypothetical protein
MKWIYITLVLITITFVGYAQAIELNVRQTKLNDLIAAEKKLGGIPQENKARHLLPGGVAQPLLYKRLQKNIPDLLVYYFYLQKDSSIYYILYEWDESNFTGYRENAKKTTKEVKHFIQEYRNLRSYISEKFGESQHSGNLDDISLIDKGDFKPSDKWKSNDSISVDLSMVLSHKFEKRDAVTTNPTYRIRLYVTNLKSIAKNDGVTNGPKETDVSKADSTFKAFLQDLKESSNVSARQHLAAAINKTVTDQQLEALKQNIRFSDGIEVFFKGNQMGFDGSVYLMLQYRYKNDTNTPPKEMIKVIFDTNNKVLGIQPVKRM